MVLKHYCCISVQLDVYQFTMVLVRYICLKNLLSIINMLNCLLPSAISLGRVSDYSSYDSSWFLSVSFAV